MKKCHLFFIVANLFLYEINQINIYVTKCKILHRNVKHSHKKLKQETFLWLFVKWVLITQILNIKYSTEV